MKPSKSGFTLIELLIVVSIITVLSGVFSKLWIGMEKMEKASSFRATNVMRSKDVIDRIGQDVRQAWKVEIGEEDEMRIYHLHPEGQTKQIRYFFEENELMREFQNQNNETTVHKVANLSSERYHISMDEPGVLQLEIELPYKNKPLYQHGGKLVSLIRVDGGN